MAKVNVSGLKGTRTRYKNILETELNIGRSILQTDPWSEERQVLLDKIGKCVKRIKLFIEKLETAKDNLIAALDDAEEESFIDQVLDEDCGLCSDAFDICISLEQLTRTLIKSPPQSAYEREEYEEAKVPEVNVQQMFILQQQMQTQMEQLMLAQKQQIDHQFELLQEQERKERLKVDTVKLPKLDLPTFSGDKLKWMEFWDAFVSAVHKNPKLSNIERFNYLQTKLSGEAKRSISGLRLSNENYDIAVGLLKERFGNPQVVIDLHYSELIKLSPVSNKTESLRNFLDTVEKHLRSLELLDQDVNQNVFVSMITSKVPRDVLLQLEINKGTNKKWTVKLLRELLGNYVVARERSEQQAKEESSLNNKLQLSTRDEKTSFGNRLRPFSSLQREGNRTPRTTESLVAGNFGRNSNRSYSNRCIYCEQNHWSDECDKYKTIHARKQRLKGSCYICLKQGHVSGDCKLNKVCVHCNQRNSHHRSLCPKRIPGVSTISESVHIAEEIQITESSNVTEDSGTSENVLVSSDEIVLMQTAMTEVQNTDTGQNETVRILLDSGSQRSYISESLADNLGLKRGKLQTIKVVTFGSDNPKVIKTPTTTLDLKLCNGDKLQITANIVPKITGKIDRRPFNVLQNENVSHLLNNLTLADNIPSECESTTIELLIGNDFYLDIILPQKIEVQTGLYLLSSKLGWILTGRIAEPQDDRIEQSMLILSYGQDIHFESHLFSGVDECLPRKPNLEDFWNVESIGITDLNKESDDINIMDEFSETLKYEDRRYMVKWPWKENFSELPINHELAMGRFKSLVNRMKDKPELLKTYDTIIQDQLKRGVIERVTHSMNQGVTHYIPHHAVIKPGNTTKVRIVYDASAKTKTENNSLNDSLYRGPVLLQDMCGILMRFRLYEVALIADIEKAFLQIGLQEDQRNCTRFIWMKDYRLNNTNNNNIQEYRFCRVPFGVISSPFLLGATIKHHLESYNSKDVVKLSQDIYVDNLITGASSTESGIDLYKRTKTIFQEASMNMRDWVSNNQTVNNNISEDDRGEINEVKVLGHLWNPVNDCIQLNTSNVLSKSRDDTKRTVLQQLASVYDPLGLFSPVLLRGKRFLQILWSKNVDWDEQLSLEDKQSWSVIKSDLENVSNFTLPRYIGLGECTNSQLHCFCDASPHAYATAIYLRQSDGNQTLSNLVFSKTRLAPVKGMTIPRLELLAVFIGVRCVKFVLKLLHIQISEIHVWSDSQCVLHWISSEKQLSTFVQNRVNSIREQKDILFHFVPSKENPADICSRGCNVQKLSQSRSWWQGPDWLKLSESEWFQLDSDEIDKQTRTEIKSEEKKLVKKEVIALSDEKKDKSIASSTDTSPFEIDIERFSSLTKLLRVTVLVLRFIKKLRKEVVENQITSSEMDRAERLWLLYVQKKHYCDVFNDIQGKSKDNLKRQLGIYIDENGLLRCGGRLGNVEMSEATRHPILLPKKDKYTELLVERIHKGLLHSGVSQTLGQIRHKYWIPRGRATVRSILCKCKTCKRYEAGPYKMPNMPPLPSQRVTESTPFTRTGLDYLGPLHIRTNDGPKKVWVCLYTCLVVRAIHLELMEDMSSEQFLLGFRRFISQRGTPKEIISDNATQFKLSNTTMQDIWGQILRDKDVQNYSSAERIQWNFIIELAPWMGGFYERLVGLVKRSLRKTIGRNLLNFQQLLTVLKEVEAVVNSRPLVYIGDDIKSNIALTPSNFLVLNPNIGTPDLGEIDPDIDYKPYVSSSERLLDIWKKGQRHVNKFWRIWRDEYLLSLRERTQLQLKSSRVQTISDVKIDDVVLIKDDLPRACWKMGRVERLVKSRDGQIRSVKVRLPSNKIIGRPLNLLFPIECSNNTVTDSDEQTMSADVDDVTNIEKRQRIKRRAMEKAEMKIKQWIKD